MTSRLGDALAGEGWTVKFMRTTSTRCVGPDGNAKHRSGSEFGIGIVYRSSRFTLATPKPIPHPLPSAGEARMMLCFDFATPRPIYACSTHLSAGDDKADERLTQASAIKRIVTPLISAGRTVFIGADLNDTPESPALNPLWDPRYGMGSNGPFVEVDSGPSQEWNNYVRHTGPAEFTFGYANRRIGPIKYLTKKIDYIFVRGAVVRNGEVGRSRFSDHDVLWANVMQ
jgi:endonuclease/exonuclease/phosphatase family metal-dependent hydrolase